MRTAVLFIGCCVSLKSASAGLRALLSALAQRQRFSLEPQAGLSYSSRARAKFAYKASRCITRAYSDEFDVPKAANEGWSMIFMSDGLIDGRKICTFKFIDDYNREALGLEVDFSLPAYRVIRSLEQVIE